MKKILIILLLFISACGYQPLHKINNDSKIFKIQEAQLIGDTDISKEIYSKLPFQIDNNNNLLDKIIIESKKETIEASKNSKGQITSYKTTLIVNFKKIDNDKNIIEQKKFKKEFLYNTKNNKFNVKEYQTKIEKNLIDTIVQDFVIHFKSKW